MTKTYDKAAAGLRLFLRERKFKTRALKDNLFFDKFVISAPKCGRTWHRGLVGHYLALSLNMDFKYIFDLDLLLNELGLPSCNYSHNGISYTEQLPSYSSAFCYPEEWKNKDVLYLSRDPIDTLASAYNHAKFRDKKFNGNFSDFLRGPNTGVDKLIAAYKLQDTNASLAKSFSVISYEYMMNNTFNTLDFSLKFIGVAEPDKDLINQSIDYNSPDNLRKLEASDYFNNKVAMGLADKDDPNSFKVRKAKIGTGIELFNEIDLAYYKEKISVISENLKLRFFNQSEIVKLK